MVQVSLWGLRPELGLELGWEQRPAATAPLVSALSAAARADGPECTSLEL